MKKRHMRIAAGFLCFFLAVLLILSPGFLVRAENEVSEVSIDELLDAGEYIEGEAVAVVKNAASGLSASGEELSVISPDALEEAIDAAEGAELPQAEVAKDRLNSEDATYSVQLFTDHSKTTAELLEELYEDPSVIAAEPNYVIEAPEKEADAQNAKALDAALPEEEDSLTVGDLSFSEWYLSDTEHQYTTPFAESSGYLLNVPGWIEGRTNPAAPSNASGTVCVVDTGIDTTHPDLQGVLYRFSEEQQERYQCGPYGLDTSFDLKEPGDYRNVTDHHGHGTHLAGIIGAEWNSFGTSGIANGIKIFAVRIFGDDGMKSSVSAAVRSFQFLINVSKDVNLKAVNCSWGNMEPSLVMTALTSELGRKGAITVFASGNSSEDKDDILDTGPTISNVYTVNVNAASSNGVMCPFSNYGLNSTDIFTAGDGILSTAPKRIENRYPSGDYISVNDYRQFFPEASEEGSLIYGPDTASGESSKVRIFDSNPALNPDAQEITAKNDTAGYWDKHSYSVNVQNLKELSVYLNSFTKTKSGFYLAIPADAIEDVRWLGLKMAISDSFRTSAGLATLTFQNEAGEAVEIDHKADLATFSGFQTISANSTYQVQWLPFGFNVKGVMDTVNSVREMDPEEREQLFAEYGGFQDPGQLTGVYGWENNGQKYVIAGFALGASDPNKPGPAEDTTLYLDDIALGNENAGIGSYQTMSGTSMAAPTVAAALAVIARDEPENGSLSDEALDQMALERTAKLLAAVEYDDENLLPYCRTGGRLNLNYQREYAKKAPLISRASTEAALLTIDGYFFGEEGSLLIDGTPYPAAEWTDRKITADLSGLLNGSHVVMVTKPEGERMQAVFAYSNDSEEGLLLYEKSLSLPLDLPEFIEDGTDFIKSDMTSLDGSLYVVTKDVRYEVLALWRYRIDQDQWTRCADFPDMGINRMITSIAGWNGSVYVSAPMGNEYRNLLRYYPDTDSWETVDLELTQHSGNLAVFRDRLFFIPGTNNPWKEDVLASPDGGSIPQGAQIAIIDPDKGTVQKLNGDVPSGRLSGSSTYLYAYQVDYDPQTGDPSGMMRIFRGSFDEAKGEVSFEEITDPSFEVFQNQYMEDVQVVGFQDGIVMVGCPKSGTDTYLLSDSEEVLKPYSRTASYHIPNKVTAAVSDGWLYVFGMSAAENDGAYLRATKLSESGGGDDPIDPGKKDITPDSEKDRPDTGDKSDPTLWFILLMASAALLGGGGIFLIKRRR